MALADELKTLQELHEKGKLTEQEYADAKTVTLKKKEPAGERTAPRSLMTWPIKALLVLLAAFLGFVWYNAGTRNTTQFIATAVHAPITLKDEVENIPAASWKAVPLNLPYSGAVEVNLEVVRGNPVDVYLTTPDQLDAIKKEDWSNVKVYGDFSATKTKTYRRTGRNCPRFS